jgi:uncharacterized phage infection (PIP) family protein YhgE
MKPVPLWFLLALLLGLTGLCVWQWHREFSLRTEYSLQQSQLQRTEIARHELESRVKAADMEILNLTATIAVLKRSTISAEKLASAETQAAKAIEALKQRDEAIAAQNKLIQQANANLSQVSSERDKAVLKLNEQTKKLNQATPSR